MAGYSHRTGANGMVETTAPAMGIAAGLIQDVKMSANAREAAELS